MNPKYDWNAIRNEYVAQGASIRDLASKYGPAKSAVQKRCEKEGWTAAREVFRGATAKARAEILAERREQTAAERREKAIAEYKAKNVVKRKAKIDLKGFDAIAKTMEDEVARISAQLEDEGLSSTNRYNLMRCLEIANKLYKDAMGIISKPEADRLELARAELKIKQEEHEKNMAERSVGSEPIKVVFSTEIEGDSE